MRRRRAQPLNPYIALSDIGLSGLLVALCVTGVVLAKSSGADDLQRELSSERDLTSKLRNEIDEHKATEQQLQAKLDEATAAARAARLQAQKAEAQLTRLSLEQAANLELTEKVRQRQTCIIDSVTSEAKRQQMLTSFASSDRNLLVRLSHSRLFTGDTLSDAGIENVQALGRAMARAWPSISGSAAQGYLHGAPIEIQVRSHCSRTTPGDTWQATVRRSLAVVSLLERQRGFPIGLVSVTGASWRRPAYDSTDSVLGTWYAGLRRRNTIKSTPDSETDRLRATLGTSAAGQGSEADELRAALASGVPFDQLSASLKKTCTRLAIADGTTKPELDDRIDVLVVFSGLKNEDTFVPAVDDQGKPIGPTNDTSVPEFCYPTDP